MPDQQIIDQQFVASIPRVITLGWIAVGMNVLDLLVSLVQR
jgi:hypothetical protein